MSADGELTILIEDDGAAPVAARSLEAAAMSPDGHTVVLLTELGQRVQRVELSTGRIDEVVRMRGDARIESLAVLADGFVMIRTQDEMIVLDLDDGPVARVALRRGPVVPWGGGRLLLCAAGSAPELVVFGWHRGVLAPIAEVGADLAPDSLEVIGERVFCRGRISYEVVDLEPAWQHFAAWADAVVDVRAEEAIAGQLVVEEVSIAPPSGLGEVSEAIRARLGEAGWCVTGPAGLAFVLRPLEGEGEYVASVADELEVHAIIPEVIGESFEWQMRDDGGAVLVVADHVAWELDLVARTARRLIGDVRRACYTADGFAVIAGGDLALYRWGHGEDGDAAEELERIAIDSEADVTDLTSTAAGRVVLLGVDGRSLLLAVHGGEVHPIGRLDEAGWTAAWTRDGAFYLQAGADDDARVRRYRVRDAAALAELAVGSAPLYRLATWVVEPAAVIELPEYPHRTWWSLYGAGAEDQRPKAAPTRTTG